MRLALPDFLLGFQPTMLGCGPSGENLVALLRHSDEVLESILQLAGRQDLIVARKLTGAREKLREMLAMIDELQSS